MVYQRVVRPLLFRLDPEQAHTATTALAQWVSALPGGKELLSEWVAPKPHPALTQTLWGYTFQNPIGLAAGFDKNGHYTNLMRACGFGFEEVGSVSARPALGNPLPRLFRLPEDEGIINRMGLNNDGASVLLARLPAWPAGWPVGISLTKTHDPTILGEAALEDFAHAYRTTWGHGAYVSINISCPNTSEGKTFEDPESLSALLKRLREVDAEKLSDVASPARPWCLKISPDVDDALLGELFDVGQSFGIAGWIATNTTRNRTGLRTPAQRLDKLGSGGLSGRPLRARSTEVLAALARLNRQYNAQQVLIGVGGIADADAAWEKIVHGASLIQVYTGLIYEGPALLRRIQAGLLKRLSENGFSHIHQAIGSRL